MDYIKKHTAHKFFVVGRNKGNVLHYLELRHGSDLTEERVPEAIGAAMGLLSAELYGAPFDIVYRPPAGENSADSEKFDRLESEAEKLAGYKREIIQVRGENEFEWLRAA